MTASELVDLATEGALAAMPGDVWLADRSWTRPQWTVEELVAAKAGRLGQRAADTGGGRKLILRRITMEHLTDFEQGDIGKTAIGILLRGSDQTRYEARPHVGKFGRDRIRKRQLRLAAAELFSPLLADERPSHRLDQIARGERAFGFSRALLNRR